MSSLCMLPKESIPKTYEELVKCYPPQPIHDQCGLENAQEFVDWLAGHKLTKEQDNYLDAISTFIERYEDENVEFGCENGPQMIKHLLEHSGQKAKELAVVLGIDEGALSRAIKRDRTLKPEELKKLGNHFNVSPELFI